MTDDSLRGSENPQTTEPPPASEGSQAPDRVDNHDVAEGQVAEVVATMRHGATGGWRNNLDQFMPVVLFLVFYNLVNTEWAVATATLWSAKAAYSRRRRGLRIGAWLPAITVYLIIRAAISIAVDRELVDFGVSSEAVYFGIGIGTKILIGLVVMGTILVGRPFAALAVTWVINFPESMRSHPRFVATMRNVTWVIVFYELVSSAWDIWLFNNSGVNFFVVTRQVVNFVVSFGLIMATMLYVDKRLAGVPGWPGLTRLVDPTGRITGDPAPDHAGASPTENTENTPAP